MRAAAIDRFGAPSVLKLHMLPVPEPASNEVLIALQASGVGDRAADEARLQVPIVAVYPLAQAARAHARLERDQVIGRIVLQIARGASARAGRSRSASPPSA